VADSLHMVYLASSPDRLNEIPKAAPCPDLVGCSARSLRGPLGVTKRLRVALAIFLVTFLSARASAQAPAPWAGLVPKGFRVLETMRGDLNRDGHEDVVLIVKATDRAEVVTDEHGQRVDRNRRGLVIAFRDHDVYRLALMNPTLFSSENEDGGVYFAPELSVSVEKGTLVLHYGHGRYGYWRYKFRYQQGQFVLIGYDRSEDRGPVVETFTSINLSNGKKLKKVNTNSAAQAGDERFVEHWSRIALSKQIGLADIADLDDGSIEKALGER